MTANSFARAWRSFPFFIMCDSPNDLKGHKDGSAHKGKKAKDILQCHGSITPSAGKQRGKNGVFAPPPLQCAACIGTNRLPYPAAPPQLFYQILQLLATNCRRLFLFGYDRWSYPTNPPAMRFYGLTKQRKKTGSTGLFLHLNFLRIPDIIPVEGGAAR